MLQSYVKLALIATVIFYIVGMNATYSTTEGVLGSVVGQTGAEYGMGNTFSNRGFLIHGLVFFGAMFFLLKKQAGR